MTAIEVSVARLGVWRGGRGGTELIVLMEFCRGEPEEEKKTIHPE